MSVEKIPAPTDIQRAILNALNDNPLHYTALRRTFRTQWTTLPPHGLDNAFEALLQQNRVGLARNGGRAFERGGEFGATPRGRYDGLRRASRREKRFEFASPRFLLSASQRAMPVPGKSVTCAPSTGGRSGRPLGRVYAGDIVVASVAHRVGAAPLTVRRVRRAAARSGNRLATTPDGAATLPGIERRPTCDGSRP